MSHPVPSSDYKRAPNAAIEVAYITREEAQRILGCQKSTIYELMRSGQLPFSNVGAKRYVRRDDLYQLIERGFNAPSLVNTSRSDE